METVEVIDSRARSVPSRSVRLHSTGACYLSRVKKACTRSVTKSPCSLLLDIKISDSPGLGTPHRRGWFVTSWQDLYFIADPQLKGFRFRNPPHRAAAHWSMSAKHVSLKNHDGGTCVLCKTAPSETSCTRHSDTTTAQVRSVRPFTSLLAPFCGGCYCSAVTQYLSSATSKSGRCDFLQFIDGGSWGTWNKAQAFEFLRSVSCPAAFPLPSSHQGTGQHRIQPRRPFAPRLPPWKRDNW